MAIELTRQQQERIQAVVERGAYGSAEEAVEAAVSALESAAAPGFEGTEEELEALLAEGLASGEPVEADEAYWRRLRARTDQMVAERRAAKPLP